MGDEYNVGIDYHKLKIEALDISLHFYAILWCIFVIFVEMMFLMIKSLDGIEGSPVWLSVKGILVEEYDFVDVYIFLL